MTLGWKLETDGSVLCWEVLQPLNGKHRDSNVSLCAPQRCGSMAPRLQQTTPIIPECPTRNSNRCSECGCHCAAPRDKATREVSRRCVSSCAHLGGWFTGGGICDDLATENLPRLNLLSVGERIASDQAICASTPLGGRFFYGVGLGDIRTTTKLNHVECGNTEYYTMDEGNTFRTRD